MDGTTVLPGEEAVSESDEEIKLSIESTDDNFVIIKLLNKNAFIPENEYDNLFNKFYRLDKSGNREKNSAGLGLAIVKNILDLHKFEYDLRSIEEGVLFTIKAPLEQVD